MTFTNFFLKTLSDFKNKRFFSVKILLKAFTTFILYWMFIPADIFGNEIGLQLYNAGQLLLISPLAAHSFNKYALLKEDSDNYYTFFPTKTCFISFSILILLYATFISTVFVTSFLFEIIPETVITFVIYAVFSLSISIIVQKIYSRVLKKTTSRQHLYSWLAISLSTMAFAILKHAAMLLTDSFAISISGFITPIINLCLFIVLLKSTIIFTAVQYKFNLIQANKD